MRNIWRMLPKLALPAIVGLGLAYLGTGFLPTPETTLRPPEELRALGQAFGEESPVRVILERNVLHLESVPFAPPGVPLAPPVEPAAAAAAIARPPAPEPPLQQDGQTGAGFAPLEPVLLPMAGRNRNKSPLSGGPRVQGQVAAPGAGGPNGNAEEIPGLEGFRLVGVLAGGHKPAAMLQVDGVALTLHPGGQAKGWTLVSVEPGQVLLRKGKHTRTLTLARAAPAPTTPKGSAQGQGGERPQRP